MSKKDLGFRKTAHTKCGNFTPATKGMTAGAGIAVPPTTKLPTAGKK